jgi:hypothetical protein
MAELNDVNAIDDQTRTQTLTAANLMRRTNYSSSDLGLPVSASLLRGPSIICNFTWRDLFSVCCPVNHKVPRSEVQNFILMHPLQEWFRLMRIERLWWK